MINKLGETKGSVTIKTGAYILGFFFVFLTMFEFAKASYIVGGIDEHITNAIIKTATNNVAVLYGGIRESDAKPLNFNDITFDDMVDTNDVSAYIVDVLGLVKNQGKLIKAAEDGDVIYEISNLKTIFVRSAKDTASFKTTFDISIPLGIGDITMVNLTLNRENISLYSPIYS